MGAPGFYLSDPLDIAEFPIAPLYGGETSIIESDIIKRALGGQEWVQRKYARREWMLTFRCTRTQLQFFRDLHETLGGQETPFYWIPDIDDFESADDAFLVTKEQDFDPVELEQMTTGDSGEEEVFDYTMKLSLELRRMNMSPLIVDGVPYPRQTGGLAAALAAASTITDGTATYSFTYSTFLSGILLSGTPLNVMFGRGWIGGQIQALKNATITPFLIPGSADWYDFYGL
jgi:hypothetical protein